MAVGLDDGTRKMQEEWLTGRGIRFKSRILTLSKHTKKAVIREVWLTDKSI